MIKLKLTFLAVILLLSVNQSVNAQDAAPERKGIERKNVIKINPISPVLKNYFFGYERAINNKFTGQLTIGITSANAANLPVVGSSIGVFELGSPDITFDASQVTLKGLTIMPEARFYAAHKKRSIPRGFYVGPYLRYQSHTLSAPAINFDTDTGGIKVHKEIYPAFDVKLTSFGIGLTWGWQAMIGQRITFDWNMGAGFKTSKLDLPSEKLINPVTGKEEAVFEDLRSESDEYLNKVPLGLRFGFTLGFAF